MGALRRLIDRLTESDEQRLDDETRDWAATIPGAIRMADAPLRERVKIAGVIRRLTVLPMEDNEALEAVVSDGTAEVVVQFMGRRSIRGLGLGTRVIVEGVLGEQRGTVKMMNPHLELSR